jgi:S-DNA-T family DNA segregation ATPase FtsK/SpoIIIE
MLGLLGWTYTQKSGKNDADKIQKIAKYSGLTKKDGKETFTIHLLDKRPRKWGTEYVYRIPLGFSFHDFEEKRQNFEDGLNIRSRLWEVITFEDIKALKMDKTIVKQIRKIITQPRPRKEVVMEYDGTLIMRVYRTPMPKKIPVTEQDIASCNGWKVWVGDNREERIYLDFEDRPHLIVAGATGFGKSEIVKLIVTILARIQPDNVKFYLIDLKGGTELGQFRHMKQTKEFGRNPEDAHTILEKVKEDMETRLDWLYENGYNSVKQAGITERHFVVIDEAADIADNSKCMKLVTDIARRGRSAGYRLIYATQYPTNETLPSQVRANIGSRIVFRLETGAQSRACLDEEGAEKLPEIEGRAIFRKVSNKIIQTPLIKQDLIDSTIKINLKPRSEDNGEPTKGAKGRPRIIKFEDA